MRGIVERVERVTALPVVFFPGFGQAEVAAVAVQEFGLDGVFQVADVFACHCGGDVERVGGAGKAAALDDLAENLEAEQGVHSFFFGNIVSIKAVYIYGEELSILYRYKR